MAVSILSVVFATTSGGTVTVPTGAQGVVAFHTHYAGTVGSSLNTISLGGASSFTIAQDIGVAASNSNAQSVSYATISSTGSQTFSFSLDHAASEGPIFCLVFVDGINTSDWIRQTAAQAQSGTTNPTGTVNSSTTDMVLGFNQKYIAIPATVTGWTSRATQAVTNSEGARLNTADSPGASTTTFTATNSDFSSVGVVSIKQGSSGVSGTISRTNANDTSSASGTTTVTGTLSRTNSNDTSAASGTTTIVGTLARTNGNDTLSGAGSPVIVGSLASTNTNDTVSASGSVGSEATGTINVTNQNDTVSSAGSPIITGSGTPTNQNDTLSANGSSGSAVSGTLNYTNLNDTSNASGTTTVVGTISRSNTNDNSAASGTTTVTGTLTKTNTNDSLTASGSSGSTPTGAASKLPLIGVGS